VCKTEVKKLVLDYVNFHVHISKQSTQHQSACLLTVCILWLLFHTEYVLIIITWWGRPGGIKA